MNTRDVDIRICLPQKHDNASCAIVPMTPKLVGTTNPALLQRVANWRDDVAWQEFFARYHPLLESWCVRMRVDRESADELCQRIWIDLARRMATFQYDPSKQFRGWLWRLCSSRAIDLSRERKAKSMRSLEDEPHHLPGLLIDTNETSEESEESGSIPALLQLGQQVQDSVKSRVDPRTWQAFWFTVIEGRSVREAADSLQMSYAAAFVARKRVAAKLREEGRRLLGEFTSADTDARRVNASSGES
jgi:RNA polymerase sigma-70 factor (ECF subfamily)